MSAGLNPTGREVNKMEPHLNHDLHDRHDKHRMKPHQFSNYKALFAGFAVSTLITMVLATFLGVMTIPLTVILPTSAPIWIGIASMMFMAMKD